MKPEKLNKLANILIIIGASVIYAATLIGIAVTVLPIFITPAFNITIPIILMFGIALIFLGLIGSGISILLRHKEEKSWKI